MSVTPEIIDNASTEAACNMMLRRFPWLRKHSGFVAECLQWQANTHPRPNFYFRWHLPRFIATCEVLCTALEGRHDARILDMAAYLPFSVLMEKFLSQRCPGCTWTRTGFEGGHHSISKTDRPIAIEVVGCVLGEGALPLPSDEYDVAILTEVIEHIDQHPQIVLGELSRILNSQGTLVLTTPNASSLKKVIQVSDGVPQYDSPTFGNSWGHRYEYSYYTMRQCFLATKFELAYEGAKDVYFNDPRGVSATIEMAMTASGKLLAGKPRAAAKLLSRRGSTLFFVGKKSGGKVAVVEADLLSI
jgi:hypothetical protein